MAFQSSPIFTGLNSTDLYRLTVKDSTGATQSTDFNVPQASVDPMTVTKTEVGATNINTCDGSITLNVSGGAGQYEYGLYDSVNETFVWQSSPTFSGLCASLTKYDTYGNPIKIENKYWFRVRDCRDSYVDLKNETICTKDLTVVIPNMVCPDCAPNSTGSLTVSIGCVPEGLAATDIEFSTDGQATWHDVDSGYSKMFTGLTAGTYNVCVRVKSTGAVTCQSVPLRARIAEPFTESVFGAANYDPTNPFQVRKCWTENVNGVDINYLSGANIYASLDPSIKGCIGGPYEYTVLPQQNITFNWDLYNQPYLSYFTGNPNDGDDLRAGVVWQRSGNFTCLPMNDLQLFVRDTVTGEITSADALVTEIMDPCPPSDTPCSCAKYSYFADVSDNGFVYSFTDTDGVFRTGTINVTEKTLIGYVDLSKPQNVLGNGFGSLGDRIPGNCGLLRYKITSKVNPSSTGAKDGSITIVGVDGVGPYQYSIDRNGHTMQFNWQSSGTFTDLPSGTYYLHVRDAALSITTKMVELI